jgi:hypothetical protein
MFRRLSFMIAAAALVLSACSSAASTAPALTDPKDILTKTVAALKDVKTMHLRADVTGSVKFDPTGSGSAGAIDLKGTTLEGDIDLGNKKLHLAFAAPGLMGVTGDLILIDQVSYVKVSLLGPKYSKSTSTDTSSPTDPQNLVNSVNEFLSKPGVAPTKLADEKCGDQDCYHVSLNLTSDQLGSVIPSGLESAAPTGSGTVDVWVRKNDLRPSKVNINATGGDMGTVAVALVFSAYDAAVTVNPPADADIEPAAT